MSYANLTLIWPKEVEKTQSMGGWLLGNPRTPFKADPKPTWAKSRESED